MYFANISFIVNLQNNICVQSKSTKCCVHLVIWLQSQIYERLLTWTIITESRPASNIKLN